MSETRLPPILPATPVLPATPILPATLKPRPSARGGAVYDAPAAPIPHPQIELLGLRFADLTVEQAAAQLAARSAGASFCFVVTPNADHLVRLHRDARLESVYRKAALCLLDSRVVYGLGRLIGVPVPHPAPGSDLTAHLLAHYLQPGERITIVGLNPRHIPALIANCNLAPPAHYNPPMGFEHDPGAFTAIVAFVRANPARFVFLAVGSPRQEYLAAAIAAAGTTGIGLCVGASLEFLAGARKRAPQFISRSGLEWLYRLIQEPRRLFRRYVINSPVVIALLLKQRLAAGRSGPRPRR